MANKKLSPEKIDLINEIKYHALDVDILINKILEWNAAQATFDSGDILAIDTQWVEIAKVDLKKGFLCLINSIEKPDIF